jgi:hypothetical protein
MTVDSETQKAFGPEFISPQDTLCREEEERAGPGHRQMQHLKTCTRAPCGRSGEAGDESVPGLIEEQRGTRRSGKEEEAEGNGAPSPWLPPFTRHATHSV